MRIGVRVNFNYSKNHLGYKSKESLLYLEKYKVDRKYWIVSDLGRRRELVMLKSLRLWWLRSNWELILILLLVYLSSLYIYE